jgi:hypothetical protein
MANTKITADNIAANAITASSITDGTITAAKLAANSVDSDQYVDGSIDTVHIADGAVTSAKLDTNIAVAGTLGVTGDANFDSNTLFVDASANAVGIGTASPATKLDIVDANGINLRFGDIASTPSSQTAGYIGMSTSAYSGQNGDLVLIPRTSVASNILLMEGKVGIGTPSPSYNMSIFGSGNTFLHLSQSGDAVAGHLIGRANSKDLRIQNSEAASIEFMTSNTKRMNIDADGRVTKPYQPAFLVTPTSQQSNLSGSTTVAFGTEIFDQDSNFASNTFTAPVTGKYQFNLTLYIVNFDVSATYVSFYIEASNRNVEMINSGSVFGATDPTYSSIAMGCLLDMDANDTCYIQCVQSGGAAQMDIAIYSRFSGFLVC